jgi:hypothetical protein
MKLSMDIGLDRIYAKGLSGPPPSSLGVGINAVWHFDEAAGNNRAAAVGGVTLGNNSMGAATGKSGNGLDMKVSGQPYLYTASGNYGLKYDKTVGRSYSMWINDTALNTYGFYWCLYDGSNNEQAFVGVAGSGMYFNFNNGTPQTFAAHTTGTGWHHWVVTFKGEGAGKLKIYKDGNATPVATGDVPSSYAWATNHAIYVGCYNVTSDNSGRPTAVFDEWYVWDKELTTAEISELYNSGNGKFYPF